MRLNPLQVDTASVQTNLKQNPVVQHHWMRHKAIKPTHKKQIETIPLLSRVFDKRIIIPRG